MRNSFRAKKAEWKRLKRRYNTLRDTVAKRLFNNILVAAHRGLLSTSTIVAIGEPSKLTLGDLRLVQRLTDDLFVQIKESELDLQCEIDEVGGRKGPMLIAVVIEARTFGNVHYLRSANLSVVRRLYRELQEKGV